MERRRFLGAGLAGLTALAGCGGGDGGGVPGEGTTTTSATTATTTTGAASAEFDSPSVGPYRDWMVSREGASLFLFTYYPEFSWLAEQFPRERRSDITLVLQSAGRGNPRPTGVLDPLNVEQFFYGFTDVDGLGYLLAQGSLDAAAARERLRSEEGYEPTGESVGAFDLLRREQEVVGVTGEMFLSVEVGFADPVANFEAVHGTVVGDAATYTADSEAYALLVDALQEGHRIQSRPTVAESMGVAAYGRQTLYGEEFSRIQEALVGDDDLSASAVRASVEANSSIATTLDIALDTVEVDGRVATVTYKPHTNAILWGGRY